MALSWSEELLPGKQQQQMCHLSDSGKVCFCFLLSSATAGRCWGCLMISPCWRTPTAMDLVLRWFITNVAYMSAQVPSFLLILTRFLFQEEDAGVRWISVLTNVADQLYYPCEHIAWAADAELIKVRSDKWWLFSTVLWGTSLLLGILRWDICTQISGHISWVICICSSIHWLYWWCPNFLPRGLKISSWNYFKTTTKYV